MVQMLKILLYFNIYFASNRADWTRLDSTRLEWSGESTRLDSARLEAPVESDRLDSTRLEKPDESTRLDSARLEGPLESDSTRLDSIFLDSTPKYNRYALQPIWFVVSGSLDPRVVNFGQSVLRRGSSYRPRIECVRTEISQSIL